MHVYKADIEQYSTLYQIIVCFEVAKKSSLWSNDQSQREEKRKQISGLKPACCFESRDGHYTNKVKAYLYLMLYTASKKEQKGSLLSSILKGQFFLFSKDTIHQFALLSHVNMYLNGAQRTIKTGWSVAWYL